MRAGPSVVLEVADWTRDDARLAPPELPKSPRVDLEGWSVYTPSAHGDAVLVSACFVGRAEGWLPEADEIAMQKLEAIVVSTYLRLGVEGGFDTFGPITREGPVRTRALDGVPAHARTWLAFEEGGSVRGCFAECVRPDARCRATVDGAHLDGAFVEPPPPTAWMRALASAVHHPAAAAVTISALAVFLGVLAILTRRRPRHRP